MRVPKKVISVIKRSAQESFGNVPLYLFGSRVDDSKRGGDIDIAVDSDAEKELFKKQRLKFVTSMFSSGFDLKVDIVSYNTTDTLLFNEIRKNCIKI